MLKIFVGSVTFLSAWVCMANTSADRVKDQAARKMLLTSIRDHITPPEGYMGATGQAHYATLFHNGDMRQALQQAKRVLSKGERTHLDWSGYRGSSLDFEHIREDLLSKEGKLRTEYTGEKGFANYVIAQPYDDPKFLFSEAMSVLSPSERKQLGWHFHELFKGEETEKQSINTAQTVSSQNETSTPGSEAPKTFKTRVSEAAHQTGTLVKETARKAGQSATHKAGELATTARRAGQNTAHQVGQAVTGAGRFAARRMADIPDTVKVATDQAFSHIPEPVTRATQATVRKTGQVAQQITHPIEQATKFVAQKATSAAGQTPQRLKNLPAHIKQGTTGAVTRVRDAATATYHQGTHLAGEVLARQSLRTAYEKARGSLLPERKNPQEELASENNPARLYEKGEQALQDKEYDKAGLFFAKALVLSSPTTKFQFNVIDWMRKSNKYHNNPLQINEEEKTGPLNTQDTTTEETDRFIHIVYQLGVFRKQYKEPFLAYLYPSQNHLKDAAFHYHPLAQYEEGKRHYRAGNFGQAFYWLHTMLSHSLTNSFVDEEEWEKKAAEAAYLVGQMYLKPAEYQFPLKTPGDFARLTEQNKYWAGDQSSILNEVNKTLTFWQALDRRNQAWEKETRKKTHSVHLFGTTIEVNEKEARNMIPIRGLEQVQQEKPEVFWARPNPLQGWEWIRWAGNRNYTPAQYDLYQMYTNREQPDIGLQWLNKAARQGHLLARYEKALQDYRDNNFDSAYKKFNLLTIAYTSLMKGQEEGVPLSPQARSLKPHHLANAFYFMGDMIYLNQVSLPKVLKTTEYSEWHGEMEKHLDKMDNLTAEAGKTTQNPGGANKTLTEEENQIRWGLAAFLYEKARSLGHEKAKNALVAMSAQWDNLKDAYSNSEQAKLMAALSVQNKTPGTKTLLTGATDQAKKAGRKAREMVTGVSHKTGQVVTGAAQSMHTHSARSLRVVTDAARHPRQTVQAGQHKVTEALKGGVQSAKQGVTGVAHTVKEKATSAVGTAAQAVTNRVKVFSSEATPPAEEVSDKPGELTRDPTLDKVWGMEMTAVTSGTEPDHPPAPKAQARQGTQGFLPGWRSKMMGKCVSTFSHIRQTGHKGWNQAKKVLPVRSSSDSE